MKNFMLVIVLLVIVGVWGFTANIVKLCYCDFEAPLKAEAIRITGIFVPPVGCVAGFCEIKDE